MIHMRLNPEVASFFVVNCAEVPLSRSVFPCSQKPSVQTPRFSDLRQRDAQVLLYMLLNYKPFHIRIVNTFSEWSELNSTDQTHICAQEMYENGREPTEPACLLNKTVNGRTVDGAAAVCLVQQLCEVLEATISENSNDLASKCSD